MPDRHSIPASPSATQRATNGSHGSPAATSSSAATSGAHALPDSTLSAFTDPAIGTPANNGEPGSFGHFTRPVAEPTIDGQATPKKCMVRQGANSSPVGDEPYLDCKPAGVSLNVLPAGRVMYYDGLEG